MQNAGLSHTASVNDHDQSLQENYRMIVSIVKFFNILNRLWKLKMSSRSLYKIEREHIFLKQNVDFFCKNLVTF